MCQHFGNPSRAEIRAFTKVLQGHIAIDTAVFPTGTSGFVMQVSTFVSCFLFISDVEYFRSVILGQEDTYGKTGSIIGINHTFNSGLNTDPLMIATEPDMVSVTTSMFTKVHTE